MYKSPKIRYKMDFEEAYGYKGGSLFSGLMLLLKFQRIAHFQRRSVNAIDLFLLIHAFHIRTHEERNMFCVDMWENVCIKDRKMQNVFQNDSALYKQTLRTQIVFVLHKTHYPCFGAFWVNPFFGTFVPNNRWNLCICTCFQAHRPFQNVENIVGKLLVFNISFFRASQDMVRFL